jgi:predicted Zn-dependent protease
VKQFSELRDKAIRSKALLPPEDAQVQRVQRITNDLIPLAVKWNARAKNWQWEAIVVSAPLVNALCMPGGKIAVFTALLDRGQLTDDELAMVIGHEMAHALREHARTRAAKSTLTNVGAGTIAILLGGNMGEIAKVSGGLMTLKFSRDDERDADLVGMELAARAGYDPEAAVTLWEKMNKIVPMARPVYLATHPSGEERVRRLKANLKRVKPIYERAKASRPATSAVKQ